MTIKVEPEGTNLHALWDTKLLEHGGLNYQQLADQYDHPTTAQIKKWQGDQPMLWAWESYQVSTQLYAEVAAMKGRNIDHAYYEAHMPIIESRIAKAGIRLAGVLNALFKDAKPGEYAGNVTAAIGVKPKKKDPEATIKIEDAPRHIGETVKICDKIYGHKDLGSIALVNMGGLYPNQLLTLVLRGDAKQLADSLDNKLVCVVGKLVDYHGKLEIIVTDSKQIQQ